MKRKLEADLKRLSGMAFGRLKHCGPLVKRFHAARKRIEEEPEPERIWNVYDWLLTPFSLWPLEFERMAAHLLGSLESKVLGLKSGGRGRRPAFAPLRRGMGGSDGQSDRQSGGQRMDEDMELLLELLPEPPPEETQRAIAEFERDVESGRYDRMLKQHAKYDEGARALREATELREFWTRIKARFDVTKYQNKRGVARRRVSGERNFREGWKFNWSDDRSRFQELLDALCYRWNLYGMEKDEPLLLKVTMNPTPYGTLIFIPRNISFDPKRDLDWKLIGRLHRCRVTAKQGPKLSSGRMDKLDEAREARRLWDEAGQKGKKGEARYEYVRERMGRDLRADEKWLWRMLKKSGV